MHYIMWQCFSICMYVCIHSVNVCIRIYIHVQIYMHIHIHVYICTCMCMYIYIRTYWHACACIFQFMCLCTSAISSPCGVGHLANRAFDTMSTGAVVYVILIEIHLFLLFHGLSRGLLHQTYLLLPAFCVHVCYMSHGQNSLYAAQDHRYSIYPLCNPFIRSFDDGSYLEATGKMGVAREGSDWREKFLHVLQC